MKKKFIVLILMILLASIAINFFYAYNTRKRIPLIQKQSEEENLYMDRIIQCPDNVSIPDRFTCLYNLSEATSKEADLLAEKLISQAPIRLKDMTTNNTGPASFVYGGSDFLEALPQQVKKAQKVKDEYINSICNLASMRISGGSGMDLEQNACKYYFTEQYIKILKSLEGGLTAKE